MGRRLWGTGLGLSLMLAVAPAFLVAGPGAASELGSRVRLATPRATMAVRSSVRRAAERLRRPECQKVFSDFSDAAGVRLQERLDELGQSGEGYLGLVLFRDGSGTAACASRNLAAYTAAGSRVVWVCADAFEKTAGLDPVLGEALLIHELLHTLGLGEGPPSPEQITSGVLARCRS